MPPVKWSVPKVFEVVTHKPMALHSAMPIATTARAKPRASSMWARSALPQTRAALAPLRESVQLTPGGRRKHTLRRTSPGGTTRCSEYISPSKTELEAEWDAPSGTYDDEEVRITAQCRRYRALHEVPCQQTVAQRSKKARTKRNGDALAAPRAASAASEARKRKLIIEASAESREWNA